MQDPYSYTAPARVKTLFLPIDDLPNEQFLSYFESFKDKYQIRLVDVTPKPGDNNSLNKFNPQGFPLGSVIYDHQLSQIDTQEIFLQDFEPFRKIFIVIGFVKYTDSLTLEKLNLHLKNLKKVFKYSIVHNIVVFDSEDQNLINENETNIFHILKGSNTKNFEYGIMCDITWNFLNALNSYAQSFQHVTLRSPGSINSNDVLKVNITNHTSSFESQHEVIPDTSTNKKPSKEKIKDTKNKGRHKKILGNFYLLAGRYTDALREFGEALTLLKSSNDNLWLANTLEYIGVCLILLSHLNVPYQLPQTLNKFLHSKNNDKEILKEITRELSRELSPSGSPRNSLSRSSTSNNNNGSISLEKLNLQIPEIIQQLTDKLLFFYSLTFTNHEDYVPQLVYCESIIRYLKFMTVIHVGNGFNNSVLNHIVLSSTINEKTSNDFFFNKIEIFKFSNKIFMVQLENMNLNSQCKIYCSLASIYDDLEFFRKKTFILRTLFLRLIPEISKFQNKKKISEDEDDELINKSIEIFEKNQQLQTQMELNTKLLNDSNSELKITNNNEFLINLLNNLLLIYGIKSSPKNSINSYKKTPWFKIHKSVLYLCIEICKTILDFNGIVFFSSILLSKYLNILNKDEQIKLISLITETQKKAKNINKIITCEYWDPFLIRDISLLNEFDESLLPIKLNSLPTGSNTTIEAPIKNDEKKNLTGAIIYNPFEEKKKRESLQRRNSKRLSSTSRTSPKRLSLASRTSPKKVTDKTSIEEEEKFDKVKEEEEEEEEEEYEDVVEDNYDDEGILLVQDEIFTLIVKFQNPFQFDIDISEIFIKTNDEIQLETLMNNNENHFTINASSITTVRIAVRPLNFGELKIIGAELKINNCEKKLFKIIHHEKFEVLEKVKKIGINANLLINNEEEEKINKRVDFKNLNLVVITPQPILSLTDLSLNNGWIMLLEGEKSSFKIILKNLSNIKINYLAFSFLDSTIEPLTKALQSKDLPINEIYEIEYYLLKRKPLRIQKSEINKLKFIKPLDYLNLSFDIKGKRGMREAQIILDYGNQFIKEEDSEIKIQKFSNYFRRINIPISVTVAPSVELAGCDLIPLFNNVNELNEIDLNNDLKDLTIEQKNIWSYLNKKTKKISDYCLLVIDLRNSWNQKFKVTLNSSDFVFPTSEENNENLVINEEDVYKIEETIAPGHTERFILPIKRIEFSNEYLERSIPSLRNKQFIVQDNKYSKEEFKFIRESFWYRKELLRHIKGNWIEEGSKREGYIELRGIRLSQRMVSILRIEKIGIEMKLLNQKNNGINWEIKTESFVTLRTKIINRSNYVLKGFLRHVPISNINISINKSILFNGILQINLNEGISPGQSKEFDIGFMILERGEYEWGAIFDEQMFDKNSSVDLQHIQREPLFIKAI